MSTLDKNNIDNFLYYIFRYLIFNLISDEISRAKENSTYIPTPKSKSKKEKSKKSKNSILFYLN